MINLRFFQTFTPEMKKNSGFHFDDPIFYYRDGQGNRHNLNVISVRQPYDLSDDEPHIWNIETYGLSLKFFVVIAKPNLLKGACGVACMGAELGVCIIWTCQGSLQTGCIFPNEDVDISGDSECKFTFEKTFPKGYIGKDLNLELALYIKKKCDEDKVCDDEKNLINEAGVVVGHLDICSLAFENNCQKFPIKEFYDEHGPLWRLDISEWDDPGLSDMFSDESFCLYLNTYYESCPVYSEGKAIGVKNPEIMADIFAQTYFLLFDKLDKYDAEHNIDDETNNSMGEEGTIRYVLEKFTDDYSDILKRHTPEEFLESLQKAFLKIMKMNRLLYNDV